VWPLVNPLQGAIPRSLLRTQAVFFRLIPRSLLRGSLFPFRKIFCLRSIAGTFSHLYVVSARFDGVGAFTPICARIWPLPPPRPSGSMRASVYVSRERLITVALREFLYIVLFQMLLDALVHHPIKGGGVLSAWTYILPPGVAGQPACHSPVTCWRC
jgi:hypothetical protein